MAHLPVISKFGNRRVLVLEPAGALWGSERALLDLCLGLSNLGWEIALCCPPNTPILEVIGERFAKVYPTFIGNLHQKPRWKRLLALWSLHHAVRDFEPSVIYVNQAGATKLALYAARWNSTPVVAHVRIIEDVIYLKSLASYTRLSQIVCVSDFIRNRFPSIEVFNAKPKITALRDCYIASSPTQEHSFFPFFRLACVGRIEKNKGQDILVEAVALLQKKLPDLRLSLVGTAPNNEFANRLNEMVDTLLDEGRVDFVGFLSDIWPVLAKADFLICPSHVEALGRTIFEAWNAGIVPIAFAGSGGPAETISAANAGILYSKQEPECLASAIYEAYQLSDEQRLRLVANGRRWMREQLCPSTYATQIADVFEEAITTHRPNR